MHLRNDGRTIIWTAQALGRLYRWVRFRSPIIIFHLAPRGLLKQKATNFLLNVGLIYHYCKFRHKAYNSSKHGRTSIMIENNDDKSKEAVGKEDGFTCRVSLYFNVVTVYLPFIQVV